MTKALATLLLFTAWLPAAPLACVTGSLASYTSLAMGCTVNSVTFAGFTAAASQGALIAPASIVVTPLQTPGSVGFRFDLNSSAAAMEVLGVLINYTVSFANSASVTLTGSNVAPDGANTGIVDLCSGNFPGAEPTGCTGISTNALAFDVGFLSELTGGVALPPGAYDVFVDLTVDGGLAGAASLSSATVMHGVPEPATAGVLALGLALLAFKRTAKP
jgi:hypothetical protein